MTKICKLLTACSRADGYTAIEAAGHAAIVYRLEKSSAAGVCGNSGGIPTPSLTTLAQEGAMLEMGEWLGEEEQVSSCATTYLTDLRCNPAEGEGGGRSGQVL